MKATIKDVASLAKVGVGTVSRVINQNASVKDVTREKVEAAIKELDYEPNQYARGLKMDHTNTVALIIPTVWHPFFSEFAYYVEAALSEENYKLYLCNSDGNYKKEFEYIQMVKQNKVDGIIGITYSDIDQYISSNLPFVSIDRHFTEDVTYVVADNYAGGELAARELIERGCKHLAYIGGYSTLPNETSNRKIGFENYIATCDVAYSMLTMPEPIKDLSIQVREFMKVNPEVDGIFTVNDFMAMDVIEVLEGMSIKVPEDVQIIGFDGIKMASGRTTLISTIEQPIDEMARAAVQELINQMNKKVSAHRVVLPVRYINRNTTQNKYKASLEND